MALETIVGAFVEHLVSEALSLAAEEFSLVFRFKKDLERLAGEFKIIQALLVDAGNKNFRSATWNNRLENLKAVASEAEDVLEEYKYELLRRKVPQTKWDKVRSFFSPLRKLAFRLKMGHKIKDINAQLKSIIERERDYGLNPVFLNTTVEVDADRLTSPYVQEAEIVGREDDVTKVINMLVDVDNEREFAVIGIVGKGEQGKTTLAQLVYKDDKVVKHFQKHRYWICVSEDFKVERLLNEMVQTVIGENSKLTTREALVGKLQENLKDKRYLLVLDDVWNENQEKWESMRNDLQAIGGSKGTKVMVTTRRREVISIMHASQTYPLGQLSDHHSLTLFKKRAFAEGGVVETPEFVEIGQRIVKKYGGVPLAIKALGSLLYSKKDIREWLSIENSVEWISFEDKVMSSIKLSYDHLPSVSLRQRFAYCSIYPKDTKMGRENLIQLWMAQGFLNPPEGSRLQMEDLGDHFCDILMRNCLLEEHTDDDDNEIKCYKMHDLVHDFAVLISKGSCVTIEVGKDHNDIEGVHLSLISSDEEETTNMLQRVVSPKLRTLYIPSGVVENVLLKFRCLRTLILCDFSIKNLPNSIGKLKLLRYLDVIETGIETLPASFLKLYNLQTLRVGLAEGQRIFLGTLLHLRHLDIRSHADSYMLVGIKHLVHLQDLPSFILSDSCKIEDLCPLDNLRGRLHIIGLDQVKNGEEAGKANLWRKPKVQHLELRWAAERNAVSSDEDILENLRPHSNLKSLGIHCFKGQKFPSWMMTRNDTLLHGLEKINLSDCGFCEQLLPLGHLPHLTSVEIHCLENVKRIGPEFYGPSCVFPALRRLELSSMRNLQE